MKGTLAWAAAAVMGGAMLSAGWATAAPATPAPATQPAGAGGATTKPSARAGHRHIPKPYSELKTLTPQQEDQIARVHEDSLEQRKKIEEKERDDVVALLTPEQQSELDALEGKIKVDRKEKAVARARKGAATQPAK